MEEELRGRVRARDKTCHLISCTEHSSNQQLWPLAQGTGNFLTESVLTGSVLTGSVLMGSVLTGSVLTGSVLTRSVLTESFH